VFPVRVKEEGGGGFFPCTNIFKHWGKKIEKRLGGNWLTEKKKKKGDQREEGVTSFMKTIYTNRGIEARFPPPSCPHTWRKIHTEEDFQKKKTIPLEGEEERTESLPSTSTEKKH